MIHTRNATLIHFKPSKQSAEYIIHQRKKGIGLFYRMFVQSYFHPFFNFSPKSIRKYSFIQMRSFRETHALENLSFLDLRPIPQFLRNLGAIIPKYVQKNYVH